MILFLAHFPREEDERDGFAQRVLAIDEIFRNENRIYIGLSIRNFWIPRIQINGKCKIVQTQCLVGIPIVLIAAIRCQIMYIHSVYNALWALYIIPWIPFIIDFHGVVPEELILSGNSLWGKIYGLVEKICIKFAMVNVCVTNQLKCHLLRKYPNIKSKVIILPIMQSVENNGGAESSVTLEKRPLRIVYSGGIQQWQNVDLMIQAMRSTQVQCEFEVYTPARSAFNEKLVTAGVSCRVESLDKPSLIQCYKHATFGFLLREPILINRVACPTKLIEYLQYGIIPIVIQPEIGDMNDLGYSYITLDDFCNGKLPTERQRAMMRQNNWIVIQSWESTYRRGIVELIKIIGSYNE